MNDEILIKFNHRNPIRATFICETLNSLTVEIAYFHNEFLEKLAEITGRNLSDGIEDLATLEDVLYIDGTFAGSSNFRGKIKNGIATIMGGLLIGGGVKIFVETEAFEDVEQIAVQVIDKYYADLKETLSKDYGEHNISCNYNDEGIFEININLNDENDELD